MPGEETAVVNPPTTSAPDTEVMKGPDQKFYKVKKADTGKFDAHFTKQGWVKKDDGWYAQDGTKAGGLKPPTITPQGMSGGAATGGRNRVVMTTPEQKKKQSAATDTIGEAFPTVGGFVGSLITTPFGKGAQVAGSGIGGMVGEAGREIFRNIMLDENITAKKAVLNTVVEGVKQGGLEKLGQGVGEVFFKMLSKIPHAEIKEGIKFLPSDLQPNGKVMKYVEDLLGNLAPSAKTMEAFKVEQSAAITGKVNTLVDGMSRFKGTSEEMGLVVQKAMQAGNASGEKSIAALKKGYISKGFTEKQAQQFLEKTNVYKEFQRDFRNELARKIIGTNKPELIAGLFRANNTALEDVRVFRSLISELAPDAMGKVQNRIMRDVLSETMTGSKDPLAKGAVSLENKFSGGKFKDILDKVGEEKLKTIYGEEGFKRIQDFVKLTGNLGNSAQGSGVGRFLNLVFILPFRSGVNLASGSKIAMNAMMFNRAAKVITSTEGMRVYENYIRAVGNNAPRAINLAKDELTKMNERSDEEFKQDELEGEYEYQQSKKGKQ